MFWDKWTLPWTISIRSFVSFFFYILKRMENVAFVLYIGILYGFRKVDIYFLDKSFDCKIIYYYKSK